MDHKGPIHFNLPFRDPLTPDLNAIELLTSEMKILPHYQKYRCIGIKTHFK